MSTRDAGAARRLLVALAVAGHVRFALALAMSGIMVAYGVILCGSITQED